jgi:hypothetical protein
VRRCAGRQAELPASSSGGNTDRLPQRGGSHAYRLNACWAQDRVLQRDLLPQDQSTSSRVSINPPPPVAKQNRSFGCVPVPHAVVAQPERVNRAALEASPQCFCLAIAGLTLFRIGAQPCGALRSYCCFKGRTAEGCSRTQDEKHLCKISAHASCH